jgi:hypothetical protein
MLILVVQFEHSTSLLPKHACGHGLEFISGRKKISYIKGVTAVTDLHKAEHISRRYICFSMFLRRRVHNRLSSPFRLK